MGRLLAGKLFGNFRGVEQGLAVARAGALSAPDGRKRSIVANPSGLDERLASVNVVLLDLRSARALKRARCARKRPS